MESHPIVHIEIPVKDPAVGGQWYAEVFGWKTEDMPAYDYVTFDAEGGPGGGFPRQDNEMYHPGDIVVYISADDIDGTLATIISHGGKGLMPRSPIPGVGWMAMFEDPSGNRMALYTDRNPPPAG